MPASPSPSSDDQFPIGSLLDTRYRIEAVLGTGVVCRIGSVDGEPVAIALRHTAHGMVNLCLGATLPAARRRPWCCERGLSLDQAAPE